MEIIIEVNYNPSIIPYVDGFTVEEYYKALLNSVIKATNADQHSGSKPFLSYSP
jgi:hypothetical protein